MVEISFECPHCQNLVKREVEDAAYDIAGETETEREGHEITHVECDCSDEVFQVEIKAGPSWKTAELIGYSDTEVEFADPTDRDNYWYDDFLDNYVPGDAHDVYLQSMSELKTLENPSWLFGIPNRALIRVMYLQYVVILEAYLSDRLITIVLNDPEKLLAFVSQVDALNKQSHSLVEILKEPDIVKKTVKGFLQRVSFHDLLKVSHFYDVVLGIDIFSDVPLAPEIKKKREAQRKQKSGEAPELTVEEQVMMDIIHTRHHLVHRNGMNNDRQFIEIEKTDVDQVRQLVEAMVARVEKAYESYFVKRHYPDENAPKF